MGRRLTDVERGVYAIDGDREGLPAPRESWVLAALILLSALASAWVYVHAAWWLIAWGTGR